MRYVNCTALSALDSATATGGKLDANQLISASFHAYFGDTAAAGVLKLQGSNDISADYYQASTITPTHWIDIPNQSASISSGSSALLTIPQSAYRWLRAVWTPTAPSVASSATIQDLTYTAQMFGPSGDAISLTYNDPALPFQALSVSVVGSDITVNLATSGTYGHLQVEDIILDAVAPGSSTSAISFEYIDTGMPDEVLAVAVIGGLAIQVTLGLDSGGSSNTTGSDVLALLLADPTVQALVNVSVSGTPGNIQTAAGPSNLSGGTEPLTSTATQIAAAIAASAAAHALVSVAVSGTGSTVQTAQSQTFLSGWSGGSTTITVNMNALSM